MCDVILLTSDVANGSLTVGCWTYDREIVGLMRGTIANDMI